MAPAMIVWHLMENVVAVCVRQYGNTALIHAAFNGLVPVVELLIEQGADLERTDGVSLFLLVRRAAAGYTT